MFATTATVIAIRMISADATGAFSVIVAISFFATFLGLLAAVIYLMSMTKLAAPEYRAGLYVAALPPAIGAAAYLAFGLLFHGFFDAMLNPRVFGFETTFQVLRESTIGILAFRFGLWIISAPLLASLFPLVLNLRGADARRAFTFLIPAAILMISCGIIGHQQVNADGTIDDLARYIWGIAGALGYIVIILYVFVVLRGSAILSEPEERRAFKTMSWLVVTVWLAYPIGYVAPAVFDESHLMWVHLVLNTADLVAFTVPGFVMLVAARRMTYKKIGAAAFR